MLGIWSEEIDALTPAQSNSVEFGTPFGTLSGPYDCRLLCDRIHPEGAEVLATYGADFYAGEPAVTVNSFGEGKAYYLATALNPAALRGLYAKLCADKAITSPLPGLPEGMEVMPRVSPHGETLLYVLNHAAAPTTVALPEGEHDDLLTGQTRTGSLTLDAYGVAILAPSLKDAPRD